MSSRLDKVLLPLKSAIVVAVALVALRTTGPKPQIDPAEWLIFKDATWALLIGVLVAFVLSLWPARARALLGKIPRLVIDGAFFAVAFAATLHVTWAAFGAWPQIQDEIAYDLLARRIADGHPVLHSHPLSEFFHIRFYVDDGREYPLFQPGWPALIALFYKVHRPWLAPAFAVATLTVFTSRLGERLYGRITGVLAGTLVIASAFVQVVGASFFAHAWSAALMVMAIERGVAALEEKKPRDRVVAAVMGGLASAWLFLTRAPTAIALFVALVAVMAAYAIKWRLPPAPKQRWMVKPIAIFAALAMLGPLGQVGWNLETTRRAFELPQTKYFNQTESVPDCHRLGFGKGIGCPREHPPPDSFPEGYTFEHAIDVSGKRWVVFRNDAWGTAWPIALAGLFILRRMRRRDLVTLAGALSPIGVYFAFYYHGNQHGARLWADVMGVGSVLVAAGACAPFEAEERAWPKPSRAWTVLHRLLGAAAVVILALVVADESTRDMPDRVRNIAHVRQAERVRNGLDAANIHDAVVYVQNCVDPDRGEVAYGWASVLNATPRESGDRLIVRDFGRDHDEQMVALYPSRKHVRIDCNGHPLETLQPATPGLVVTEMEAKFPPDERAGCYTILRPWPSASNRAVLEMRATDAAAFARFRQYVPADGTYEITLAAVPRPDGGKLALAIDGVELSPVIDTKGPLGGIQRFVFDTKPQLKGGVHTFEVRSKEPSGVRYFWLDRLELRKL